MNIILLWTQMKYIKYWRLNEYIMTCTRLEASFQMSEKTCKIIARIYSSK